MKKLLILLTILMAFISGCKNNSRVIRVATDATWPPMEFLDDEKNIAGFDIDMIKAIAREGGFELEVVNTAWDGIFAGLTNGSYDAVISSVTITDERKISMDFSLPYINAGQVIIVPVNEDHVNKLKDLKGKKVGAQINTTGATEVEMTGGVELRSYDELELAIEDLANGNIQAVVADNPTAADYVLNNDQFKGKLKIAGAPFTEELYGIAVKKGNVKVLEKINSGLVKVIDSGLRDQLIDKWLR